MKKSLALAVGAICTIGVSPSALAVWDAITRSELSVAFTYAKPSNVGDEIVDTFLPSSGSIAGGNFGVINLVPVYLEPGFKGNYALGYRYLMPCTASRFFMDYEHYQNHKERGVIGLQGGTVGQGNGPVVGTTGDIFARTDIYHEMLRGGIQHSLEFGPQFFVDVSAYLEYDWLKVIDHDAGRQTTLDSNNNPLLADLLDSTKNKTHGFGPGVGLKLIGAPLAQVPAVQLFGGVMTTLLYSDMLARSDHTFATITIAPQSPNGMVISLQPESINALLAKFDVDFGIEYNKKMMLECEPMIVGLTLGVHYLNIVNALRFTNESLATVGIQEQVFGLDGGEFVDWGRVGPYLALRVGGAQSR